MKRFNIRVYGVCVNEYNEVLVSDESYRELSFTKFPGGGLEWGEGTKDCLQREFMEEFNLEIEVGELFYLTDFFQVSAFSANDQVISIYYQFAFKTPFEGAATLGDKGEQLRWISLDQLTESTFKFPIDQLVATQLIAKI